jgi:hypothetical protein
MKRTVLLVLCTAVAAQALSAQGRGHRNIRRHGRRVPNNYIVVLAGTDDPEAVGLEQAVLRRGRLGRVFRNGVHGFSIRLTDAEATALAQDPRVGLVEEDAEVHATVLAESSAPWGLDRIDQRKLPLDGTFHYVEPATPVFVHVVDTGVRVTHREFGGRAFNEGDYVGDGRNGADCNGHGTHVAATIAGGTYGVAKTATILSHRVLDCSGTGAISDVIAAVDAIAGDPRRPAVANMSLGGEASDVLDDAVRRAITAGVTFVVAAGNDSVDASTRSPARVKEAITVGAVDNTDRRAYFSNFGSTLDLFAPGVSVASAWYANDTATATLSGTSMAAPHVAGVAALYLGSNGDKPPFDVAAALAAGSTAGLVGDPGTGSPNRLLFSEIVSVDKPLVRVSHPNGAEKVFTGTPYRIEWEASGVQPLQRFDVLASTDNGATYTAVAGCSNVSGSSRSCTWSAPGPASAYALVKVVATDAGGGTASDTSDARFSIVSGTAAITVTSPNTAVNWGRGSLQDIKWTHNLGAASYVRIEVSRDGGVTFPETLAMLKNTSSAYGTFRWRVTGPDTTRAVIRVSWTSGSAHDTGNTAFTVAEPYIKVSGVSSTTNWGYGTAQRVGWTTNLGPGDLVGIDFSQDSGSTYGVQLASNAVASAKYKVVVAPAQSAPSTARILLAWNNAPAGFGATSTSVSFTTAPPFVKVTRPNGGDTWTSGTSATIAWSSNLGTEKVRIDLSRDGGASYPIALSTGTTGGSKKVTVSSGWATASAKVRVAWAARTSVADASDATFQIH